MTTIAERILLMQVLRNAGEIGGDCDDGDGHPVPELCPVETAEAQTWIHELRDSGPPGERAYRLVLTLAKRQWVDQPCGGWSACKRLQRRVNDWLAAQG